MKIKLKRLKIIERKKKIYDLFNIKILYKKKKEKIINNI